MADKFTYVELQEIKSALEHEIVDPRCGTIHPYHQRKQKEALKKVLQRIDAHDIAKQIMRESKSIEKDGVIYIPLDVVKQDKAVVEEIIRRVRRWPDES